MTTDIQLLRSSVARKRPDPSQLLDGQAAINTNAEEPGLFFKLTDGNLTKIGPALYNTNGNAPNSSPAGTAGNAIGETWLDGRSNYDSAILRVWNGANWLTSSGFTVDETSGDFSLARRITGTALIGNGTGDDSFIKFPNDTEANRPVAPEAGMARFNTTDNVFEVYNGTSWVTYLSTGGGGGGDITINDITVDGDANLGSSCGASTITINGVTAINCDTTIGATTGNTLTVTSRIASDLIPNTTSRDLGSNSLRWAEAWITTLNASGSNILGSGCNTTLTVNSAANFLCNATVGADAANTVTFNSSVASNFIPDGDETRDLGSATRRWNRIFVSEVDLVGDLVVGDNCTTSFTVNSITNINCSMTIGAGTAGQTLNIRSAISSGLISDGQSRDIGSTLTPWNNVFTNNLTVGTNVTLGSNCGTSTVTVNGVLTQNCETNYLNAVTQWNRTELRFSPTSTPAAGSTFVGFQAPATIAANVVWSLPNVDGSPGQVLSTDGGGNLSWVSTQAPGADLTVQGNLVVEGNTTLGNSCVSDTLTVNAVSTFNCNNTFGQNNTTLVTFNSAVDHNADTRLINRSELKFHTGNNATNHVGFRAPATINSTAMWQLPPGDGGNGTVLTTNGTGELSWQAVASNVQPVTVGDSAPTAGLANGQLWWNSSETANNGSNRLYVYYDDGDSQQWVDASPAGAGATNFVFNADIIPTQDNAFDIGSATNRVAEVYANEVFTGDLHMKNERGDWTLIEEEEFLSIRCNKTGKRFKFLMEQLDD